VGALKLGFSHTISGRRCGHRDDVARRIVGLRTNRLLMGHGSSPAEWPGWRGHRRPARGVNFTTGFDWTLIAVTTGWWVDHLRVGALAVAHRRYRPGYML